LDVGMRIMLRWILEKYHDMVCTRLIWLGVETSGRICDHGSELSGSIKCWEVLEQLNDWWLLKKDSQVSSVGFVHKTLPLVTVLPT
jgi:hypothetical protein